MTDSEAEIAGQGGSSWGRRSGVAVLTSVLSFPLLAGYVFHLLWFLPVITYSGPCEPGELGCGPEHGVVLWVGTLLALVMGTVCLILTWAGLPRAGRWWPRPVATVTILVGWSVVQQLWLF